MSGESPNLLKVFDLTGRVALVTGSCRGNGQAIALGLAEAGADLVLCCRYASHLEETGQRVGALGRRWLTLPCDVAESIQVTSLVNRAIAEFGRIDVLVNNAGGALFVSPVEDIRELGWDRTFAVNMKGVFLCSQAAGRVMIRQGGGVIINVVSVSGRSPDPGMAPYAAAKAGVISFTRTLSVEWAKHNIRINALGAGLMATKLSEPIIQDEEYMAWARQRIVLQRPGQPHELAGAAVFLASDASSYMTGEVLWVSGGTYRLGLYYLPG
ncbi:MAG: SDR family oxidoreductase [Chloroflexi bacterium]|nr:SDR family oxidoreductase [Chloroflexota bacterium]